MFSLYCLLFKFSPQQNSLVKERSFGSGLIKATAWIDRTGYCTGDTINFNARIENLSGKSCTKSFVRLIHVNW